METRTIYTLPIAILLLFQPQSIQAQIFEKVTQGSVVTDVENSKDGVWGDYDLDLYPDLFVPNEGGQPNSLYRNSGDGTFEVTSAGAGVNTSSNSSSGSWADYDGDGDLDLLVTNLGGGNLLYRNDGDGTFTSVTNSALVTIAGSFRFSAWADYDLDGDLDVAISTRAGQNNLLFNNDGNGSFVLVDSPVSSDGGNSQRLAWGDFDNDGDPDLFVANYSSSPNFLYENLGNGTFARVTDGPVATDTRSSSAGSWADFDNDGDLDLLVVNDESQPASLYRNEGNGQFTAILDGDVVSSAGAGSRGIWADIDNDGDLDLFVSRRLGQDNRLYINNRGSSFTLDADNIVSSDGGHSQLASWSDFDRDGDIDLFVANNGSENFLYENKGSGLNWISFTLKGTNSSPFGLGTKIRVLARINGQPKWQLREVWNGQQGYGDNTLAARFGLDDATIVDSLEVHWPSGITQRISGIGINQYVHVQECALPTDWLCDDIGSPSEAGRAEATDDSFALHADGSDIWGTDDSFHFVYQRRRGDFEIVSRVTGLIHTADFAKAGIMLRGDFEPDAVTMFAGILVNTVGGTSNYYGSGHVRATKGGVMFGAGTGVSGLIPQWFKLVRSGNVVTTYYSLEGVEWVQMSQHSLPIADLSYVGLAATSHANGFLTTATFDNVTVADLGNYLSLEVVAGDDSALLSFGHAPNASEGIDTAYGETELPPPPPLGAFDTRFILPDGFTGSPVDVRPSALDPVTWRIAFQPGLSGYPLTFSWNPASLSEGSFSLRDEVGGSMVNVNMRSMGSYTLTNESVTTLLVEHRNNLAAQISVVPDWNLLSVPLATSDMTVSTLFPDAVSNAFSFRETYISVDSLETGQGYWLKFSDPNDYMLVGQPEIENDIQVGAGWNLIGPYDATVQVASITTTPSDIVTSSFFRYSGGYQQADDLASGFGYWVKVREAGTLHLGGTTMASSELFARATVNGSWIELRFVDNVGKNASVYLTSGSTDFYMLPPAPPVGAFDVRFSTQRYVENVDAGMNEVILSSSDRPINVTANNLGGTLLRISDVTNETFQSKSLPEGGRFQIPAGVDRISVVADSGVPVRFELFQNYPNPFNPATIIAFALPTDAFVDCTVFNTLGQVVERPVRRPMLAGYHQVRVESRNLASGIYFYQIRAGSYSDIKQMILLR